MDTREVVSYMQGVPATGRHMLRNTLGALAILIGLFALFTPLTPGSWLIIVGAELLGVRLLFADRIRGWFQRRVTERTPRRSSDVPGNGLPHPE